GSPRGDPAVAVGSSLDVAVGWVCAWAWSFPLRRECRKTTIINGRVGEEKPRSKAPILSDRSLDVRDFRLGEPLVTEMERAVVESRYTLAVLSPAYLTSSFTDFENVISQHLGLEESQNRLLLAVREPCEKNLRFRYKVWLEMKDDEEVEENVPRLIRALGDPRGASPPGGPE